MVTKFDIDDAVYIKGKVKAIDINQNKNVLYNVSFATHFKGIQEYYMKEDTLKGEGESNTRPPIYSPAWVDICGTGILGYIIDIDSEKRKLKVLIYSTTKGAYKIINTNLDNAHSPEKSIELPLYPNIVEVLDILKKNGGII